MNRSRAYKTCASIIHGTVATRSVMYVPAVSTYLPVGNSVYARPSLARLHRDLPKYINHLLISTLAKVFCEVILVVIDPGGDGGMDREGINWNKEIREDGGGGTGRRVLVLKETSGWTRC